MHRHRYHNVWGKRFKVRSVPLGQQLSQSSRKWMSAWMLHL
jgi:hypothetical protein